MSLILALVLILALAPLSLRASAATVSTLEAPENTDYRFNGHWVTDRGSFELYLDDWTLGTFTDEPAIITAGASAGEGIRYCSDLSDAWYGKVSVCVTADDEAGIRIGRDKSVSILLKTQSGALTVSVACDGTTLLEEAVGNAGGTVTVIVDNTLGTEGLKLYVYGGDAYLGGWELTQLDSTIRNTLADADCIAFYATKEGTQFRDFAINDMIYRYADAPAAALALVEGWAKSEVEGSIVYADNGVPMYTPDGVKNYNALWTRDFNYMLEYAGEYIPVENAVACIEYLLEHVHEGDCWLPDRVYSNGSVNYAAGDMDYSRRNLDNNSFIVISLDCVLERMDGEAGKALFEKWETTLMTALDSLPKDENGLVYNDPQNPHSPYGFTDCICKTGSLMKESLLLWRAYSIMAKWQSAYGLDASVAAAGAKRIEDVLISTFQNEDGMLDAATVDCRQTDIWGSCYAVSIGFPMEESLKKSIADYLAENYNELVQMGQLRHTAPGEYWDRLLSGVNEGEYQNGAYWATPTGWLVDTLVDYYPQLALVTIQDIITYYEEVGIYECVNGDYLKLIHYAASASNILPAARKLLTVSADLRGAEISGDSSAATGATKTYTVVTEPTDTKISSYAWTVDGKAAGRESTLTVKFSAAGTCQIACVVTDINGNSLTARKTVTVADGVYSDVTITAGEITGKKGDTVTVRYRISEGSMLAAADLEIRYDPALMAPMGDRAGVAAGKLLNGVASGKITGDGTVRVSMAAGTPVTAAGEILTVTFQLLQDAAEAVYAEPVNIGVQVDYRDGTGLHPVAATVIRSEEKIPATGDVRFLPEILLLAAVSGMGLVLLKKKRIF